MLQSTPYGWALSRDRRTDDVIARFGLLNTIWNQSPRPSWRNPQETFSLRSQLLTKLSEVSSDLETHIKSKSAKQRLIVLRLNQKRFQEELNSESCDAEFAQVGSPSGFTGTANKKTLMKNLQLAGVINPKCLKSYWLWTLCLPLK